MAETYETFTVVWCNYDIKVSIQVNWLNTEHWHIELRCPARLSVTETGFRSHFVPDAAFSGQNDVRIYVLDWLETAAHDPSWTRYVEDSKQLNLF